jgi:hypothetical protein
MEARMSDKSIEEHKAEAEYKAIDSLARYKFMMFGYWAGIWVHLNKISGKRSPSPFSTLVKVARMKRYMNNKEFCHACDGSGKGSEVDHICEDPCQECGGSGMDSERKEKGDQ